MKSAKLHPQEQRRLRSLTELNILDTIPEIEFDRVTQLAAYICETPIALISLVDENRQWFKSKVGLSAIETPREVAFCSHAILQKEVLIVKDSSQDERFFDNPLFVGDPHVQFYAGSPLLSPEGMPIGTLCVIDRKPRDLSEKQVEMLKVLSANITEILRLRVQNFQLEEINKTLIFQSTALQNMLEGLVIQVQGGAIIDFNLSALRILGLSADQLLGKSSLDPGWRSITEDGEPFHGESHPAMIALKTGLSQSNVIMGISTPEGELRWISITSVPIHSEDKKTVTHAVTTFLDITEKRLAEQAVVQAAKMSSLGEMAGGIAHEINTPLAIISICNEQIRIEAESTRTDIEKIKEKSEKIDSTVHRIATIVRGLRSFARQSDGDPWQLSKLSELVQDAFSLCAEKFRHHQIKVTFEVSDQIKVDVVPQQISQVILNLLSNSFDAIHASDNAWIKISAVVFGSSVILTVTDSGQGIPLLLQSKIMNPFFSTKEVGKGTGLGLSISKGIIESFGGTFEYNNQSSNTQFKITLPKPKR